MFIRAVNQLLQRRTMPAEVRNVERPWHVRFLALTLIFVNVFENKGIYMYEVQAASMGTIQLRLS